MKYIQRMWKINRNALETNSISLHDSIYVQNYFTYKGPSSSSTTQELGLILSQADIRNRHLIGSALRAPLSSLPMTLVRPHCPHNHVPCQRRDKSYSYIPRGRISAWRILWNCTTLSVLQS
jgi:hypothetical protein